MFQNLEFYTYCIMYLIISCHILSFCIFYFLHIFIYFAKRKLNYLKYIRSGTLISFNSSISVFHSRTNKLIPSTKSQQTTVGQLTCKPPTRSFVNKHFYFVAFIYNNFVSHENTLHGYSPFFNLKLCIIFKNLHNN